MRQIRTDLWETRTDNPFPGLTTHGYLWTGGKEGNVLFYSTATDADFDDIAALGGVAHQYLSHQDEAGPQLARIADRFSARLHAPAAEADTIGKHAPIEFVLSTRHMDGNGIEVIPTPGHSPGSTSYLVPGANGQSYLFTGDTVILGEDGDWFAGNLPGYSDPAALVTSLRVLAHERPDLVISSAFSGPSGVHAPGAHRWAECVEQARAGVKLPA